MSLLDCYFATLPRRLKFYASHVAGFSALATVAYDLARRDWPGAVQAGIVALAAFGVNITPTPAPDGGADAGHYK